MTSDEKIDELLQMCESLLSNHPFDILKREHTISEMRRLGVELMLDCPMHQEPCQDILHQLRSILRRIDALAQRETRFQYRAGILIISSMLHELKKLPEYKGTST
jgi:hypothetical protein